MSTIAFFEDLCKVSENATRVKKDDKLNYIKQELKKMNEKLPAAVYVPFLRGIKLEYQIFVFLLERFYKELCCFEHSSWRNQNFFHESKNAFFNKSWNL